MAPNSITIIAVTIVIIFIIRFAVVVVDYFDFEFAVLLQRSSVFVAPLAGLLQLYSNLFTTEFIFCKLMGWFVEACLSTVVGDILEGCWFGGCKRFRWEWPGEWFAGKVAWEVLALDLPQTQRCSPTLRLHRHHCHQQYFYNRPCFRRHRWQQLTVGSFYYPQQPVDDQFFNSLTVAARHKKLFKNLRQVLLIIYFLEFFKLSAPIHFNWALDYFAPRACSEAQDAFERALQAYWQPKRPNLISTTLLFVEHLRFFALSEFAHHHHADDAFIQELRFCCWLCFIWIKGMWPFGPENLFVWSRPELLTITSKVA